MALHVERERVLRVPELRGKLRDGDALGDLDGRVAVPEVVRVEVRDARRLAGPRSIGVTLERP